MKELLETIYNGQTLSTQQAYALMQEITAAKYPAAQVAALLSALRMRKVTAAELKGFRQALLDLAVKIEGVSGQVVDVCGTGGDNKHTFNISTCVSFLVAALGVRVAKHGNYAVSSKCGSSNVIEALGIKFPNAEQVKQSLELASIAFLHAPLFHPAMKNVAQIRKDLAVKTVFNILGPLVNPVMPSAQLVGVHSPELVELYRQVLIDQPGNFCIVHSLAGYDEVSLTGEVMVSTRATSSVLKPADFGCDQLLEQDLYGADDVAQAAQLLETILQGKGTRAQNDVVSANAGILLWTLDQSKELRACVEQARQVLLSGRGFSVLQAVRGI